MPIFTGAGTEKFQARLSHTRKKPRLVWWMILAAIRQLDVERNAYSLSSRKGRRSWIAKNGDGTREVSMSKIITVALAAAFLLLAAESVSAAFSLSSLKGPYVFQVHGFQANETTPPFHTGEFTALSLLTFNGMGGVKGFVFFDGGDSNGDLVGCQAEIDTVAS